MSAYSEVFKKITFGINFNVKRFKEDAELFGIGNTCKEDNLKEKLEDITPTKRKYANNTPGVEKEKDLKKEFGIQVFGNDAPDPIQSFQDIQANIPSYLFKNMKESNYNVPTPVQMQAIPILNKNRHALVCAPTGSGKTFAYIFPILCHISYEKSRGIRALIILPTKELASQIFNEIQILTTDSKIRSLKIQKLSKSKVKNYNSYQIIVSTPQRLVDLLNSKSDFDLSSVDWFILDEGDLLLADDVKGFKNQIATIYNACSHKSRRCIFSATINNYIEDWVNIHLDDPLSVLIGEKNSPPEAIHQELLFVGQESGKLLALRNIFHKSLDPPILIFVNDRERVKELFSELVYDGINVDAMHSDRTETQRVNIVNAFRTGKIWVLIATDLMSRGLDFKGIKMVINYDPPNSAISYIHRIGRTGRSGLPGSAITFYTEKDVPTIKKILPVLKRSNASYPPYLDTL